ncbi:PucR family transcriptional regulator [Kitasatospora sp. NPDC018619]|uniref:PucR family transcriptional regulator n=1 Tax=unclassified Kitasatospora TaxID=2633591 RepID=UPI003793A993
MTEQWRRAPADRTALRELIDDLAESLGRSVALVDPSLRRVCSSRHFDDADRVRLHSLLHGRASGDVLRHALDHGVTRWSAPGFLTGRDDLGLLPRYCVPLRERGHLLGLLSVVAPEASLPPAATVAVARAVPDIAGELYADHLLADAGHTREQDLLLSLLGPDPAGRAEARERLLADALLPDAAHAVVSIVQPGCSGVSPGRVATVLHGVLEGLRRTRSADGAFAVTADRAVLLRLADRPLGQEELREQSARIVEALGAPPGGPAAPVIGVGGPQTGLAEARTSYEQALVAVRAARRMPDLDGVGSWEELGEFAVLLQLPDRALNESLLPKPLRALIDSGCGHRLEETLRCFLDHAGSVPRTAEALRIHRTSLYYRLRRIQEITGLDLDNGADRTTLHLGLRVRQLLLSLDASLTTASGGASGRASGDGGRPRGRAAAAGGELPGRTLGAAAPGRPAAGARPGQRLPARRPGTRHDGAEAA